MGVGKWPDFEFTAIESSSRATNKAFGRAGMYLTVLQVNPKKKLLVPTLTYPKTLKA